MEFLIQNIAPIMFGGLIVFLLLGFPVAFSLGACGLFFGFYAHGCQLLCEVFVAHFKISKATFRSWARCSPVTAERPLTKALS